MSMAIMILAIGIGTILEQAMPSSAFAGFARPPVLALIVAYYALNHSVPMLLATALLGGILGDGIGSLPLGITTLTFVTIGAALYYFRDILFSGKMVTNIVLGAVIGMSATLIVCMLLLLLGRTSYSLQPWMLFLKIIGTMIYSAVFFPVIYILLKRLELLTGAAQPACPSPVVKRSAYFRASAASLPETPAQARPGTRVGQEKRRPGDITSFSR